MTTTVLAEGTPCRQAPDLWMSEGPRSQARAKALCHSDCPIQVRLECLRGALERNEKWGVWGGVTTPELKDLRRRIGEHARKTPKRGKVA